MSKTMSVFWNDDVLDKRFNFHYPIVIRTPNGETIESARYEQVYLDDQQPEKAPDPKLLPGLSIKGLITDKKVLADEAGRKAEGLKAKRVTVSKTFIVNGESKKSGLRLSQFVDNATTNDDAHGYSLVVANTKRTQETVVDNLKAVDIFFTMSNDDEHVVRMSYLSMEDDNVKKHRVSLWNMAERLNEVSEGDHTDDDILAAITEADKSFTRFNGQVNNAGKRAHAKAPKRKVMSGTTERLQNIPRPLKRAATTYTAIGPDFIAASASQPSTFYMVVKGARDFTVTDMVINPQPPCRVTCSTNAPGHVTDSSNMYSSKKYRDIVTAVEQRAGNDGDLLIWFGIDDVDDTGATVDMHVEIDVTLAKPSDPSILRKATSSATFMQDSDSWSMNDVIASMYNYGVLSMDPWSPVDVNDGNHTYIETPHFGGPEPEPEPLPFVFDDHHGEEDNDHGEGGDDHGEDNYYGVRGTPTTTKRRGTPTTERRGTIVTVTGSPQS